MDEYERLQWELNEFYAKAHPPSPACNLSSSCVWVACMNEYERLQGELNEFYGKCLDKFLENELEAYNQAEQEKM
eukprot:gene28663-31840_t